MIYLDNNATTRVAPEVLDAMQPYLSQFFGNPSSAHALGREMKRAVDQSREQVASLIGAADTSEIVFTSCGSESDNWAIRGVLAGAPEKKHIVTTLVEHEAVRNLCRLLESEGYEVTWLGVDQNGELDLDSLRTALRPDTALVSIMLANNETGVLFPIEEIGRIVRENSQAAFHVDGVQAVAPAIARPETVLQAVQEAVGFPVGRLEACAVGAAFRPLLTPAGAPHAQADIGAVGELARGAREAAAQLVVHARQADVAADRCFRLAHAAGLAVEARRMNRGGSSGQRHEHDARCQTLSDRHCCAER